jgi:adenylate cyclase
MPLSGDPTRISRRRLAFGALLTGVVAGLLCFVGSHTVAVERLEATTLDWRFHLRGPLPASGEVATVVIDEASIKALGGWPLSRRHLAAAVDTLREAGARTIAFDLLFAPRAERMSDGDTQALAATIAHADNVVLGYAFDFDPGRLVGSDGAERMATPPIRAALHRFVIAGSQTVATPRASGVTLPEPALRGVAADLGHMNVLLGPDGALRSEALLVAMGDEFYPSIALQTARRQLGLPPGELTAEIGREITLGRRHLGTDASMRLPINFYGPKDTFAAYSLIDLLDGRVPPEELSGRAVVIGSTATAASPGFVTPYDPALPSVAYTATVLDNLLSGRTLTRPDWLRGLELVAAMLGAALAFVAARQLPAVLAPLTAAVPIAAWAGLAFVAFVSWQVWLTAVLPVAAIVGGTSVGALARSRAEQRRRKAVARERENLSRYFSPAVAERLARRGGSNDLTGVQDATVLFVDLVGSTGLGERLSGEQVIALLRGFHERVERAVFANGGTLDKYLGDGALAVFGVPEPMADDATRALACAVALHDSVAAWREELIERELPALQVAIGVHHGPVLMGDIGGESRFEFTVLGDTVNVASRLEGLTRELGVSIVASEAAIHRARERGEVPLGFVRHGEVSVRGREARLPVWIWRPHAGERAGRHRAAS